MKTFSYSYIKHSPRVPSLLLTVEKFGSKIFAFVVVLLLLSFLFSFLLSFFFSLLLSSFFLSIKHVKLYGVYEQSAHQMNARLSEIFFLVRDACELRSTSYGPKHTSQGLSCMYTILCVITHRTRYIKVVL